MNPSEKSLRNVEKRIVADIYRRERAAMPSRPVQASQSLAPLPRYDQDSDLAEALRSAAWYE